MKINNNKIIIKSEIIKLVEIAFTAILCKFWIEKPEDNLLLRFFWICPKILS